MTENKPAQPRQFTLKIVSRRKDVETVERLVTLWADLAVFEDLKNCPVDPIDLLNDTAAIERTATDKYLQGRLLYVLSDAQDLDPREFARGVVAGQLPEALAALRGALLDFFLSIEMPDRAQAIAEAFAGMVAMRGEMARTMRDAKLSEKIVEAMRRENVDDAVTDAMEQMATGLRRDLEELGKTLKPGTPGE